MNWAGNWLSNFLGDPYALLPAINKTVAEGIPGAESVIYPGASHMAHVEDTAGYVRLLDEFLGRVEQRVRASAQQP